DRLASRLAIVDRGRIVAEGTPDELKRELRGDTILVELVESANGDAAAAVVEVSGVSEIAVDGRTVRARAADGATVLPSLISALPALWWARERAGLKAASPGVPRPSRHAVTLRHAGRSFQQNETDHEKGGVAA